MFWFKGNNSYKKDNDSWSTRYKKDYDIYHLREIKFNSSQVSAIYKITGYWFLKNEEEYGTEEYKKKEEELKNMNLYIVEVGNYVLDVSEETYNRILKENQIQNMININ